MNYSKLLHRLITFITLVAFTVPAVGSDLQQAGGARPFALGNAYIGLADDGHSPFWNPAGSGLIQGGEFIGTMGRVLTEENEPEQNKGSFALVGLEERSKLRVGVFGVHSSTESIRRENILGLTLARQLFPFAETGGIYTGVNVKYIQDSVRVGLGTEKTAVGIDWGVTIVPHNKLSLGFVVKDLNRPRSFATTINRRPATYGFGLGLLPHRSFRLSFDAVKTEGNESTDYRTGVEKWFLKNKFAFRAGSNHDAVSVGFGLAHRVQEKTEIGVDYAFSYPYAYNPDDRQHIVSFRLKWDEGKVHEDDDREERVVSRRDRGRRLRKTSPLLKQVTSLKRKSDLLVGPKDRLTIAVKDHDELTTTVTIDDWGYATFPFVGEIRIKGLSVGDIRERMTEIYEGFVDDPQVTVQVTQFNSRVIYILGQVKKPGKYALGDRRVTLREAIVLSELPTDRAALWRAFLIRQTPEGPIYHHVNLNRILHRGKLEKNITLQSGDIVFLPMTVFDKFVTFVGRLVGPLVGVAGGLFGGGGSDD